MHLELGQLGEDVLKVCPGIDLTATAAFDHGVDDRSALSGASLAHEQPVLLAHSGRADGIFHQVIIDLYLPVAQVNFQYRPLIESVVDRQPQRTLVADDDDS